MRVAILTERYGEIAYEENMWTGSKKLSINGIYLTKLNRKTFGGMINGEKITVAVKGGYISGVTVDVNGLLYRVTEGAKWYDYVFTFMWVGLYAVLSISHAFNIVFPIAGGLIGGAVAGLGAAFTLYIIKPRKNVALKLVISLGFFAAVMAINHTIAIMLLNALYR